MTFLKTFVLIAAISLLSAGTASAAAYVVVLDNSVARPGAVAAEHAERFGGEVTHVYRHALKGYAATLPASALGALEADARVTLVEPDHSMRASTTQSNATWGLDRIDQPALPLSTTFTYTATGAGVKAYIIDTGIKRTHSEFGGRAIFGYDAIAGNGLIDDCNGHGTHVAGTVGGATYGVAKAVTLVAVRVLDCSGFGLNSWVIAGVDWVTGNHQAGQPAVANMSLGGGVSAALDTAVRNSIADGVTYAIAAGNGDDLGNQLDACDGSPSRVAEAITVSASDRNDRKASWANYGPCVDWFAPGVSITSAWFLTNSSTNTISGTSMATPHTAGVAAQYLQGNPAATPAGVRDALYNLTTKDVVAQSNTANNHLLFTSF
jgi:subtilisin family serine protease